MPSTPRWRLFATALCLALPACGGGDDRRGPDASAPDAASDGDVVEGPRCVGPLGEDLGPLEPPTDACERSAAAPEDPIAAAACLGYAPFVRGDFEAFSDVLLGDVTARRFRVEALSHLWPTYQAKLEESDALEVKAYARVGDASIELTSAELDMLAGLDAYTMRALYCLDHPLPGDFAETLAGRLELGGYEITHVLMALFWLRDQGCDDPTEPALFEESVALTAALIDDDHAQIDDLEVEAAAFLAYLGRAESIPEGFVQGVVDVQAEDGSWSAWSGGGPNGHTSGLALWLLHELLFPERATTMVTPCVRTAADR